ncbi:22007_t:CDS:2 [Entrophospora sp. SA101]|nr:10001_t:CDS:2 [Entrophospora sp. SA101]CAJ0750858.1 22007_t:CDS:2 [Entrophospora sp. SA101]CAJ0824242.1 3321_t:CDS:2 [Entrophospora sp. SA101]CAJ0827173.1 4824_t:CDS:2 [Entrophospora sp. SA101]
MEKEGLMVGIVSINDEWMTERKDIDGRMYRRISEDARIMVDGGAESMEIQGDSKGFSVDAIVRGL